MKSLVVMAAGMGSRFGGLKQIEPIGPNGEVILDYSIYDAKRSGFDRVVFVIKKEIEDVFKENVGKRLEGVIDVKYAFQEIDNIPKKQYLDDNRKKPWGTVQAVLAAKDYVEGDFAIINADDFYGYDSFKKAADFLDSDREEKINACITYPYINVSSKYGSVKRGVCYLEGDNITDIVECSIETNGELAKCTYLETGEEFDIDLHHPVSMNMFALKKSFFNYLEDYFDKFFDRSDEELETAEAFLPEVVKNNIKNGNIVLKNIESNGFWMGLTYKSDLEDMKNKLNELIKNGEYPSNLWS